MRITELSGNGRAEINAASDGRGTIRLPITIRHRSSRKQFVGLAMREDANEPPVKLTPFQLALVKGHCWLAMLEAGEATSMKEIAKREKLDPSLVSRLINFTTLAPEIVGAILEDALPRELTLLDVAIDPALNWCAQLESVTSSHQGPR